MARAFNSMSLLFILAILSWGRLCVAQASQQFAPPDQQNIHEHSPGQPAALNYFSGSINETIVDPSGALVAGARVTLAPEDQSAKQEGLTDGNGQFSFTNVAPGPFHLAVASAGFAPQTVSGVLHPGETETVPQVALAVASNLTEVNVALTRNDIATEAEGKIKVEEKQRVFGIIPNFYVSYIPHAAPLTSKQKFKLTTRSLVDPFTLLVVGASAGAEQATKSLLRIRSRRAGLRQALWRQLRRCGQRHFHRRRRPALAAETGSALFLQGHRKRPIAISVCPRHVRGLQRRQRTLATQLFGHPRKPRCPAAFQISTTPPRIAIAQPSPLTIPLSALPPPPSQTCFRNSLCGG